MCWVRLTGPLSRTSIQQWEAAEAKQGVGGITETESSFSHLSRAAAYLLVFKNKTMSTDVSLGRKKILVMHCIIQEIQPNDHNDQFRLCN